VCVGIYSFRQGFITLFMGPGRAVNFILAEKNRGLGTGVYRNISTCAFHGFLAFLASNSRLIMGASILTQKFIRRIAKRFEMPNNEALLLLGILQWG